MNRYPEFSDLLGKTLVKIGGVEVQSECIDFYTADEHYRLYHARDCCESVQLEEIHGDVSDLIGSPILLAEEVSNADGPPPEYPDSYTWTFYKLATTKGHVTLRWLGESNGYYGEEATFVRVKP